jgi:hypothetical protein
MPKAGKKSSGGGQKRTADDSSPAKPNPTQPAKKKANLSDKEKEIDLLKHQLNEQNKIIEKIKTLKQNELAKYGIAFKSLQDESDSNDSSGSDDENDDDSLENNKIK